MTHNSQPLDQKFINKLGQGEPKEPPTQDGEIISQRIGTLFDDLLNDRERRPSLKTRIGWRLHRVRNALHGARYAARNRRKWRKTLRTIRPWEGFDGLISVMLTHLRDYVETEEKYGHSTPECKEQKITSARGTIELLECMKDPGAYSRRLREEVKVKYPKYQSLITKHRYNTSYSGYFVEQGNGWTGTEGGTDPREGYFEFVGGRFELVASPDQAETDRLLVEIRQYHKDLGDADTQAAANLDKDFKLLAELLKENLYTWWD